MSQNNNNNDKSIFDHFTDALTGDSGNKANNQTMNTQNSNSKMDNETSDMHSQGSTSMAPHEQNDNQRTQNTKLSDVDKNKNVEKILDPNQPTAEVTHPFVDDMAHLMLPEDMAKVAAPLISAAVGKQLDELAPDLRKMHAQFAPTIKAGFAAMDSMMKPKSSSSVQGNTQVATNNIRNSNNGNSNGNGNGNGPRQA